MPKRDLHFNPHTLSYEHVKPSKKRFRKWLYIILTGIAFGLLFIIIVIQFFETSGERKKRRELELYKNSYQEMSEKYNQSIRVLKELKQKDRELFRMIFETDPIENNTLEDPDGFDLWKKYEGKSMDEMTQQAYMIISRLSRRVSAQERFLQRATGMASSHPDVFEKIPISLPLKEGTYTLVSGFGERIHPIFKTKRMHTGIDFAAKQGTPIYATASGVVVLPNKMPSGHGTVVMISHGKEIRSVYSQLLESLVKPGQAVVRGQLIGYVGSTGIASGPHLHYEIWRNGIPVDPFTFFITLTPEKFHEMRRMASLFNQCMS